MTTPSTDHKDRAIRKLLGQFSKSPKIQALTGTYAKEVQAFEDLVWEVVNALNIESGEGVVLDRIGAIVGRGRQNLADTLYRYALRAQIRINKSSGLVEDFLEVARLAVHDEAVTFLLEEVQPAAVEFYSFGPVPLGAAQQIWLNIKQVKAGGVRLFFNYSAGDGTDDFLFASSWGSATAQQFDEDHGWGWTGDVNLGGKLAGEFVS